MTEDDAGTSVGTVYRGPVTSSRIAVGGEEIVLVRPADPDRLLDDPAVHARNRRDDYMPYWAYLWPGALLLAEAVAAEAWPARAETLEIGCGLGLAGLMGLARGLRVTFSDYDDAPLDFAARSALANGHDPSTYSTRLLEWRQPPAADFAVILGSDVLYERRLVPLVAGVVAAMLAPGGVALISDPCRSSAAGFAAAAQANGLACDARAVAASSHELGPVRGTLYRITKPGSIVA